MIEDAELENERYDPSIREDLKQKDWETILPGLLYYAHSLCRKYYWLGNRHLSPQDLVQEAIARAFGCGKDGGYRNWNKERCPDLSVFLKSTIKSIVNHKIEHLRKFPHDSIEKHGERVDESPIDEDDTRLAKSMLSGISGESPEEILLSSENTRMLSERVNKLKSLAEDDEEIGFVIMCFEEGISTPREIAETTGYNIHNVYNIIKRIKRKARNI